MPEPSSVVTKSAATTARSRLRSRRVVELEEVEGPLVVQADQLVDRDRTEHLGVVAEHVGDRAAPSPGRGRRLGPRTRT